MDAPRQYSRRDALGLLTAAGGLASVQPPSQRERSWSVDALVEQDDAAVRELLRSQIMLRSQITDGSSAWLALEIAFRDGGQLEGCTRVPDVAGAFVLARGMGVFRSGRNEIRFGPRAAPHRYVQLRGAGPNLPGQSVYITGTRLSSTR